MKEVIFMSKHQEIIAYLEKLPIGKRVSVLSFLDRSVGRSITDS